MLKVLIATSARDQLDNVLTYSERHFGPQGRERYEALIEQALVDLAEFPARRGTEMIGGVIHYHIRHSRRRVPKPRGQVHDPRHLVLARVAGDTLRVLAFAYGGMSERTLRRLRQEGDDTE